MAGPGGIPKAAQGLTAANYNLKPIELPAAGLKTQKLDLTVRPEFLREIDAHDQFGQVPFRRGNAQTEISLFGSATPANEPAPLFNTPLRNPDRPMTKGEMIDRFQDIAQEQLGEDGFKVAKGLAGLGYVATGGKVKYSKELQVEGFDSVKMGISASAKKGGTLNFEIKGSF